MTGSYDVGSNSLQEAMMWGPRDSAGQPRDARSVSYDCDGVQEGPPKQQRQSGVTRGRLSRAAVWDRSAASCEGLGRHVARTEGPAGEGIIKGERA
jgi:hypothetical protein